MGKKNKASSSLGKALMKDKHGKRMLHKNSMRHTSEIQDGQDYNRINFSSITEQTDVENFLATAELAGRDFKAERLNVKVITPSTTVGVLTEEEREKITHIQQENKDNLRIPRRPPWDRSMSAEELAEVERETFLDWRRNLAQLQEKDGIMLTPYEKNIEFWRQLWRVIEKSDVVVQIVDARNPLLFHCEDLAQYVKEVNHLKENLLLVNKADFLTEKQREIWACYFKKEGINAVFFSATSEKSLDPLEEEEELKETENEREKELKVIEESEENSYKNEGNNLMREKERIEEITLEVCSQNDEDEEQYVDISEDDDDDDESSEYFYTPPTSPTHTEEFEDLASDIDENLSLEESFDWSERVKECRNDLNELSRLNDVPNPEGEKLLIENADKSEPPRVRYSNLINSKKLLSRRDLVEVFKCYYSGPKLNPSHVTIGLVGYPNVGKSSTINGLLKEKKVSVSATPGKTKHFQTLFLTDDILLCDCPGLVFPGFVTTKEEMIISGILPIDQMRDHVPPVNLVLSLIPRHIMEAKYGVKIPLPKEGEDPKRNPHSEEFLKVYGQMRGYMSHKGVPDHPRSARYILKDYINGKLLYCHCPPGHSQKEYHEFTQEQIGKPLLRSVAPTEPALDTRRSDLIDEEFFSKGASLHVMGRKHQILTKTGGDSSVDGSLIKPWRVKPARNIRQKARKKYAHLDKHD